MNDIIQVMKKVATLGNCHYRLDENKPGEVVIEHDKQAGTIRVVIITPGESSKTMTFSAFYFKNTPDNEEFVPFITRHDHATILYYMQRVLIASSIEGMMIDMREVVDTILKQAYSDRMMALVVDEVDDPYYTPDPLQCYDEQDLKPNLRQCDNSVILDIDVPRRRVALWRNNKEVDNAFHSIMEYAMESYEYTPTLHEHLHITHDLVAEFMSVLMTISIMMAVAKRDRYTYILPELKKYTTAVRRGVRIRGARDGSFWNMNVLPFPSREANTSAIYPRAFYQSSVDNLS